MSSFFLMVTVPYIYHQQAKEFEPTVNDYEEWLEGLKEPIQKEMKKQGFDRCKNILSFTRYVLEKNDVGMEEFIKEQMGMEEYSEYNLLFNNGRRSLKYSRSYIFKPLSTAYLKNCLSLYFDYFHH